MLLSLGFSYRFVTKQTGLSIQQIAYRAYLVGLKVKHYRDGDLQLATDTLETMVERAERFIAKYI